MVQPLNRATNKTGKEMARETSIEAYNEIKSKGLLSVKRMEIYEILFYNGKMTSAEAYIKLNDNKPKSNLISQSRARFTELRDMGCLSECGTKKCSVTGKTAIVWEVTSNLPSELPKTKSRKEIKKEAIELIVELGGSSNVSNEIKIKLREIYKLVDKL